LQTFVVSILGILFVGVFDWMTGNEVSFAIFYLLPICFAAWYGGFQVGFTICIFAAASWFTAEALVSNHEGYIFTPVWNALVRFTFFLMITYLLTRLHGLTEQLEMLVRKRTASLETEIYERKRIQAEMGELEDRELRRLAQELHDRVGSYLAGIAFRAKILSEELNARNAPEKSRSAELVTLINTSISNVRKISRLLTPIEGEHQDLKSALSRVCAEMENVFGICCSLLAESNIPPVGHDTVEQLCRITQEAVRNGIQHGDAKAIEVSIRAEAGLLSLTVRNDGKRWNLTGSSLKQGLGLRIMRSRTERIGGNLSILPGLEGGTCIRCDIPIGTTKSSDHPNWDSETAFQRPPLRARDGNLGSQMPGPGKLWEDNH
jgi:signal transduction histidine kinase